MTQPEDPKKLRVALLYGGRSTEHEISLESATSVLQQLDPARYDIVPVYIDQQGTFHRQAALPAGAVNALPTNTPARSRETADARTALRVLPTDTQTRSQEATAAQADRLFKSDSPSDDALTVVLPIVHGPLCEDGSLQGLLELCDVPYVGSRVLGSALCMDKDVAKRLVCAEGIPIVPYLCVRGADYETNTLAWIARIEREIGYPTFVKPATLGSSVGVTRAENPSELTAAIQLALRYDDKLLIEKALRPREIEFAVLAARTLGDPPDVSVPGEIRAQDDFYSFERKYLDAQGAQLSIPADISPELAERGRQAARRIFQVLECDGMARVDFFLDKDSGELYFNEVNTIPGFTSISMYPKLWEASGVPYAELLDRLIQDAVRRHERRARLSRTR